MNLMRVIGAILGWMLLAWQPGKDHSDGTYLSQPAHPNLYIYTTLLSSATALCSSVGSTTAPELQDSRFDYYQRTSCLRYKGDSRSPISPERPKKHIVDSRLLQK